MFVNGLLFRNNREVSHQFIYFKTRLENFHILAQNPDLSCALVDFQRFDSLFMVAIYKRRSCTLVLVQGITVLCVCVWFLSRD